jgi:hypothetical protein
MDKRKRLNQFSIALGLIALSGAIAVAGEPLPEPLPEERCAGGCSVAGPPTAELSATEIARYLGKVANQPLGEASLELETLLFHAGVVIPYIHDKGLESLKPEQSRFLKRELSRTHAHIRLRVVDAEGKERMSFDRRVAIGEKQHLHPKEAQGFATPEISFTIHRVGLQHLWSRL